MFPYRHNCSLEDKKKKKPKKVRLIILRKILQDASNIVMYKYSNTAREYLNILVNFLATKFERMQV